MRMRTWGALVSLAVLLAVAAGCSSGGDQESAADVPADETAETSAEGSAPSTPSSGARSRGVATIERNEDDALEPLVVLDSITYEWRVEPERGLSISLGFINPNDTYERARGYVIAIASYRESSGAVYGVYPWDAELTEEGFAEDHTEGSHLLYRRDQLVRGFIPYGNASGYYNVLRVLVYSEDGDVLIDNTLDLEVSGEPTGRMTPPVDLTL